MSSWSWPNASSQKSTKPCRWISVVPLKEVNSLAPRLDDLLISRFVRVMMQVKLCYHLTVLKNPVPREEPHEGDRRLLEEWEEKEVEPAELWVRNYTMVEILPSRGRQPTSLSENREVVKVKWSSPTASTGFQSPSRRCWLRSWLPLLGLKPK